MNLTLDASTHVRQILVSDIEVALYGVVLFDLCC